MTEEEVIPKNPRTWKTISHANRILRALERIYDDPEASVPEVLQAAKLASEILERRPPINRKTAKDKAIEKLLGKPKGVWKGKKKAQD